MFNVYVGDAIFFNRTKEGSACDICLFYDNEMKE